MDEAPENQKEKKYSQNQNSRCSSNINIESFSVKELENIVKKN